MTVAAICLDATGTLIETAEDVGEVYHRIANEYGVDLPAWRLEDAFRRILRGAPERGTDGDSFAVRRDEEIEWWSERIRETFQATDSTARFADFPGFAHALFETYRAPGAWRLRPGVKRLLTQLQRNDRPLAIVSNFDHRLPEILETLEIASFFKTIVIPCHVGRVKPDRALFEAACDGLSLSRNALHELAYVGDDSDQTLLAIERLGLQVLNVRQFEDLSELPDRLAGAATLLPIEKQD